MTNYESYAERVPYAYRDEPIPPFLDVLASAGSGRLVEVGCGDGGLLLRMAKRGLLKPFDDVLATDISATRISRVEALRLPIRAACADAAELPVGESSVDLLVSDQVIEHVPDDSAMATEIARVLTPQGRAVIGSVLKLPGAWYYHRCEGRWTLDPTHLREYGSLEAFSRVFEHSGLEVEKIATAPVAYPIRDLIIRALRMAGLRLQLDSGVIRFRLRIPRYYLVYAQVKRRG